MSFLFCLFKPLVYLSPIIAVAWFTPTGRYYLRLGIYLNTLCVVGMSSGIIASVMAIAGRKYDVNSVVAYTFYWIVSRALNITVEVEGEEHLETRPAVLIGNHQSVLDILWLGRCVRIRSFEKNTVEIGVLPMMRVAIIFPMFSTHLETNTLMPMTMVITPLIYAVFPEYSPDKHPSWQKNR